jgi:hypothetical protein
MGPGFRQDDYGDASRFHIKHGHCRRKQQPRLRVLATRFARALHDKSPSKNAEGAGKAGWPLHPGPRAKEICASARTTGTGGDHTGLPRAMVYGLYVFSPVNRPLPPSPSRSFSAIREDLAPAWARQDHTTSPSANVPYVYRHIPVHRIPLHVRDDAYAPRVGAERRVLNHDFRKNERGKFFARGLDKLGWA